MQTETLKEKRTVMVPSICPICLSCHDKGVKLKEESGVRYDSEDIRYCNECKENLQQGPKGSVALIEMTGEEQSENNRRTGSIVFMDKRIIEKMREGELPDAMKISSKNLKEVLSVYSTFQLMSDLKKIFSHF